MNNDITLAKLIGSPKQIKWAEDIRENAMWFVSGIGGSPERKALMARISTAKWWIDHRNANMTLDLLKAAVAEDEAAAAEEQEEVERRRERDRSWNEYQRKVQRGEIKQYDIDGKLSH